MKKKRQHRLCPAQCHIGFKKKGGWTKIPAALKPVSSTKFDSLLLTGGTTVQQNIAEHLGVPSTTTHVCATCWKGWMEALRLASPSDWGRVDSKVGTGHRVFTGASASVSSPPRKKHTTATRSGGVMGEVPVQKPPAPTSIPATPSATATTTATTTTATHTTPQQLLPQPHTLTHSPAATAAATATLTATHIATATHIQTTRASGNSCGVNFHTGGCGCSGG